jgi:hypothetical protein
MIKGNEYNSDTEKTDLLELSEKTLRTAPIQMFQWLMSKCETKENVEILKKEVERLSKGKVYIYIYTYICVYILEILEQKI